MSDKRPKKTTINLHYVQRSEALVGLDLTYQLPKSNIHKQSTFVKVAIHFRIQSSQFKG